MSLTKYEQVAAIIRAQITDGMLRPGEPAPSAAALSRMTGYSTLTCRKGLATLVRSGILVPGASPSARPLVPARTAAPDEGAQAPAGRALSTDLAVRRRAAGLTQPQLAQMLGKSVTSVAHAETGRLWQSRDFWEHADKALSAGGALLALHDTYRAVSVPPDPDSSSRKPVAERGGGTPEMITVIPSGPVACVSITWADGQATIVYPPETPVRPADATPANWPHR